MLRSMPAMSWRNYVGLSLRGPEVETRHGRPMGYGWGPDFARRDRASGAPNLPDHEVFAWLTGQAPIPTDHDTSLLRKLKSFHDHAHPLHA